MGYSVVDVEDVPYTWGTFKFVRHHIGATAFGFAQIDFPPDKVGSEHDETESGQEEVYLTLSGAGTLDVDGETVEMRPGRYVLVPPDATAATCRRPGRHVVPRHRRRARRRLRALGAARGMIVRIVLWRLDETTPSLDDLRGRLEDLEPLEPPGAMLVNDVAERIGAIVVADDDEDIPPQIEHLRLLVGRDPDLYEEFDTL